MTKLTPILALLLTGCQTLQSSVYIELSCNELHGQVGNNCKITAPSNASVKVDGGNVEIIYKGE